jgi:type II secretory ATPase GspE/PulE/Tfp pilus assembly ATPase PilB-like protein
MVELKQELPEILSADNCRRYNIAPVVRNGTVDLLLICPDTDRNFLSVIKFNLERDIDIKIVNKLVIEESLDKLFLSVRKSQNDDGAADSNLAAESHPIIELIDDITSEAIRLRASDIHLEPFEDMMLVRYRLDGVLQQKKKLRKENISSIVSRIKIMSGLDIAEKRRPQDGRIRFKYKERTVDIRVSVLPTDFGEKIVMRLLDKATLRLDLESLGFDDADLALFKEKISLPHGIILITGPTGSGKTTTLYAALNYIKSPGINITTIEDPIEYNLEGINQTNVKPDISVTFASALRAILRQDPNVIMVGEIRDSETLENALRASLTGHLVLSTLHTNDSLAAITRLIDLGADRNILKTSIKLIVAQRLVRRICPHCITSEVPENEQAAAISLGLTADSKTYYGKGCDNCLSIGFWGRTAIYEMLPVDEHVSSLLFDSSRYENLRSSLDSRGFVPIREKGLRLVGNGITAPSEILRETG